MTDLIKKYQDLYPGNDKLIQDSFDWLVQQKWVKTLESFDIKTFIKELIDRKADKQNDT